MYSPYGIVGTILAIILIIVLLRLLGVFEDDQRCPEDRVMVRRRKVVKGTELMGDGMDDKLKGTAEEVAGEVQEEWGKLTDNPAEIEKGRDKKMKGHYEKAKGGVKDKVEDLKEKF
jgi:uncharacterized protein YjbJ (UPF0337 family)